MPGMVPVDSVRGTSISVSLERREESFDGANFSVSKGPRKDGFWFCCLRRRMTKKAIARAAIEPMTAMTIPATAPEETPEEGATLEATAVVEEVAITDAMLAAVDVLAVAE